MITVSEIDKEHYLKIRKNVSDLIKFASDEHDNKNTLVLDVAPEIHKGASEHFVLSKIKTLDLDVNSKSDFIANLCENNNKIIPDNTFDVIICTEVLEHTENPFFAVKELFRMIKKGGVVYASTPFNFRIHNPLPDNWRFTEHGLRVLFKDFENVEIIPLIDIKRDLMPIHYTIIAKK